MAPALASKTLEGVGVPPVGCTFMPSISPLTALPLISTYSSSCPMARECATFQGSQSRAVSPRQVCLLWELGWPGVPLSVHPLPWPLSLGMLGVLAGLLPCPTLVRATINLAICCPNSVVASPESVATAALALFLSWIPSFLLSTLHVATINCKLEVPRML